MESEGVEVKGSSTRLIAVILIALVAGFAAGQGLAAAFALPWEPQPQTQTKTIIKPIYITPTTGLNRTGMGPPLTPIEIFSLVEGSVVSVTVRTSTGSAEGSGFIYGSDGYLITNDHVVADRVLDQVDVTFLDGSTQRATIVGSDPFSDLAVLKIDPAGMELIPILLGNSSQLEVGEPIVAIGNPFGLSGSMTAGIVSQLGRDLEATGGYRIVNVIQVDAAINPGNSGGPLLNMWAEVVGVNTAILSETGTFSGVGFAIPSNTVRRVADSIIATGSYTHPYLGVSGMDVSPALAEAMGLSEAKGFLVMSVVPNEPADRAGVRGGNRTEVVEGVSVTLGGDVIVGVDSVVVRKLVDMVSYLENKKPGDVVVLKVLRAGTVLGLSLTLGKRPPPP